MKPRVLDLFAGGGGSSWGAFKAGAEIVCGVDAWDLATKAYRRNFPGARAENLRLEEDTRPAVLGDLGRIDLLLASPECTNHTCARGSRPKDEASRATARYVINFAQDLKPRWVVVENVVHMRSWSGYHPLLDSLHELGYQSRTVVLDAAAFGVPQNRRRMFILADRERQPDAVLPSAWTRTRTVEEILDPPGTWESTPLRREGRAKATLERAERAMAALPAGTPFLIVYYGSDSSGGWQPLNRPLRTVTTIDRFGLVTWQRRTPMLRMLQVPELMRAMGLKGGYSLESIGHRRDRIRLLGNGVAPPVMKAVVKSLLKNGDSEMASTESQQRELLHELV